LLGCGHDIPFQLRLFGLKQIDHEAGFGIAGLLSGSRADTEPSMSPVRPGFHTAIA
jgi:hypothetical protein